MSYTYKGTKITGTSTNAYIFSKSGISNAQIGQTYFNTSTGHVYQCADSGEKYKYFKTKDRTVNNTKTYYRYSSGSYYAVSNPKKEDLHNYYERQTITGTPDIAKWRYLRTDIAKRPSVAVSSLGAPTRENGTHEMKATWRTPSAMVDPQKGDRATKLDIKWYLGITGKDPSKIVHTTDETRTESVINLNNMEIGRKTYKRSSFYPFKNKPVLHSVSVIVVSKNDKGAGARAKSTREFLKPRKPTISDFAFNAETGEVSCTINTDAGNDYHERYDTRYKMDVYYSNTKKTSNIHDDSTTSTSKTIKFDDAYYASRSYDNYAKVTVKAWARGYKGDSEVAEKIFYVSYPAQASITDVNISSKDSTGKCTIYVNTHSSKEHPVDRVKLEYLANSDYEIANEIPGDASWEETDIVDNSTCKALAISVSNLIPDRGKYTWLRLKTYHANETVLYRYSKYWRVKDLETPAATAVDDNIKIVSANAGEDGESAVVELVWDDGDISSTGTELSWDVEENAWKSTKEPDSYKFSWSDGPLEIDEEEWPNSATITIKKLDEASKYFIKARRYNEGEAITYSEYSNTATVVTSEKPESVTATANRYVSKGSGLNVYWTFAGNSLQKEWQIVDSNGTILANGEGSLGSAQIPADRLEAFAENGDVTFTVQISTGSGYVISEEKTVTIIEQPIIEVTDTSLERYANEDVLKTNNLSLSLEANKLCDLKIIVTSQGCVSQFPQGILRQTAGDTIHSDIYVPVWEEDGDLFITTIDLPPALDFWDLGLYTVSLVGIDRQTNLQSENVALNFRAMWEHQAPDITPTEVYSLSTDTEVSENKNYYYYDDETEKYVVVETAGNENPLEEGWYEVAITEYVTLTPIDGADESGFYHKAVQINLTPPPNSEETDVYDIYRMTGDGAQLIGESFPLTFVTTDEYAPFGENITNAYRIAVRTEDGDVSFYDVEYVLEGEGIRLDWTEGFLQFPYSISINDSYEKDVEIRKHINGGINGYWNQGVERKGDLNTDAIKIIQKDDIDLTRKLARYNGPVFVRTREGTAFEADVQVKNLNTKNIAVMSIALDATEIDLTEEFMLPIPFVVDDEEGTE